jgi:hypothetical protein
VNCINHKAVGEITALNCLFNGPHVLLASNSIKPAEEVVHRDFKWQGCCDDLFVCPTNLGLLANLTLVLLFFPVIGSFHLSRLTGAYIFIHSVNHLFLK